MRYTYVKQFKSNLKDRIAELQQLLDEMPQSKADFEDMTTEELEELEAGMDDAMDLGVEEPTPKITRREAQQWDAVFKSIKE